MSALEPSGVSASTCGSRFLSFLRHFFRQGKTIGAVVPTSQRVARRMARLAGIESAKAVAEFGPGTGAITTHLLGAMPASGRLWGFEVYEPFIEYLRDAVRDARFILLGESAETIEQVRATAVEAAGGFDAVVSSIPFSLIGPEQSVVILRAVAKVLRPGGSFVALQYHPKFLAPLLHAQFEVVEREFHLVHLPPVFLFRARNPRRTW